MVQQDVETQLSWTPSWKLKINQQLDYGFGDRYRQPDHFNAVVDWLIWQNHQAFLSITLNMNTCSHYLPRIDAEYWQKLLDWLPQNEHVQFLKK